MRMLAAALSLSAAPLLAQSPLHSRLVEFATTSNGHVYVACSLPGVRLDCNLEPHGHPPMQSTFKLPLAVAMLHEVEAGRFHLEQRVRFLKSDQYKGTYSPLQDEFPEADVEVPLSKLIKLAVEKSDNTATDIQLRLLGGPLALQRYLDSLGLRGIHVRDTERGLHDDSQAQYRNYAEPSEMVALLRMLADGHSPLNAEHTALLNTWMLEATSGPDRIKGLLPAGTPVAHKTGTSGSEKGFTAATNDVGLITLPNGKRLAIAVFVTDAHSDTAACEHVIASVAKAVYDAAIVTP